MISIFLMHPDHTVSRACMYIAGPAHHLIASDLALFFGHLGRLGYAIVSREDNPFGNCCSEFLLLKVADWAALQ